MLYCDISVCRVIVWFLMFYAIISQQTARHDRIGALFRLRDAASPTLGEGKRAQERLVTARGRAVSRRRALQTARASKRS